MFLAAGPTMDVMLPESLRNSTQVYSGPRFDVHTARLPGSDGEPVSRDAVVCPDSVVVLPLLDEQTVILIRNERFVVGKTLWELPAGMIKAGEDPLLCAKRELIEETGYEAGRIERLTAFYLSPGLCTEYMHAYVAQDLTHVGQDLDVNERITVEVMSVSRSMQMVRRGEICDVKTIASLLYYRTFVG